MFFIIILGFKPITQLPILSFPLQPASTSPRQRQLFDLGT